MKNTLALVLMVFGIIGCSDRSQDNLTEIPASYMFATSENTYIIEEQCLLQNAQKCKTENCNNFIQGFCSSQGQPYESEVLSTNITRLLSQLDPINFDLDGRIIVPPGRSSDRENQEVEDLFIKTLKDQNRAKKIIDDAIANEHYKNIYECKLMESRKCKTNKCSDFVSGYCERFEYFKGEKLIAKNLRLERYEQERVKIYSRINLVLSNPDSYPVAEVGESFCFGAGETYVHNQEAVKFSCEDWFLMEDSQRKERKLPLQKEYRWDINPFNPERIMASDAYNLSINIKLLTHKLNTEK